MAATTPRAGVDLGGTKIEALVLGDEYAVLGRARRETPQQGGPPAVVDALVSALEEALAGAGLKAAELAGIGVGSPGVVDDAAGTVSDAGNLPDWLGSFELAPALSERLAGARVRLGNDVSVAVGAEHRLGAGRPYDELLGVWWGTGVGGGLVLGGELHHGRGFAGEFGHMVVRRGGALCGCGNRGCVEAYAGRKFMEAWARRRHAHGRDTKLFEIMRERERERLTSGVWWRAIKAEDALALRAVERAVHAIGAGIASAVNLLDLPAVVVGGGMGERFLATHQRQIERAMHANLFRPSEPPQLLATELGDDGGAIGAALLVDDA